MKTISTGRITWLSLLLSFSLIPALPGRATANDLSADEHGATSKHIEQAHGTAHQQVSHLPAAVPAAPMHAPDCHIFSNAERRTIEKGHVVIGSLEKNGHKRIRARIHIAAPPQVVWETVHEERKTDPDLSYSKVLESSGHTCMLEQKFQLIPVVGTSVCLMKNVEIPGHRIDYWLVKSDRFKALEGSWIVSAAENGGTVLELSSFIDMGLPVPRHMLEAVASKKIEHRLENIRKMAEKPRSHTVARKTETGG